MSTDDLITAVFQRQGYALFESVGSELFRLVGPTPGWLKEINVAPDESNGLVRVGKEFPFLHYFLIDAQELWVSKSKVCLRSGTWIEKGKGGREIPLKCSVFSINARKVLLIREIPQDIYDEQHQLLQTARQAHLNYASELSQAHEQLNTEIARRNRVEDVDRVLQEKNLELENAHLAKDRFLANMSHELRTPLNSIIGFTGVLLMRLPGSLTEEQARQIRTIQGSAKHLLSLINDLLDLAKIGSGKVTLNIEDVSFQAVVEDVCATLGPLAETKGLNLKMTLPKLQIIGKTDRRALSQILLNLTNNAIKYTDSGEVRVVLEREIGQTKTWIKFNIHDTGIGISPEDQPKLFQRFSQLGRIGRCPHESTGLGLQLSQRLAELLGGQITWRSEYGKGSTFTLSVPC